MKRRTAIRTIGGVTGSAVIGTGLAGCLLDDDEPNGPEDDDPEPEEPDFDGQLRIVTYRSMVTGTNPAGPWLAETFEERYPDAELEWIVPEAGIEHYVRRGEFGAEIDADICFGFTVGDLARIDDRVGAGALLRELNTDRIDGTERVRDDLAFGDPHGRAIPYDTGYVGLVYDETVLEAPGTFAELLGSEYTDALLAQHPVSSMPGQAFLLWTIETGGPDEAMTYWERLTANGAQVRDSWTDAYGDYLEGDRSMVVSYSTDPVFGALEGHDPARHRVAFPDDAGYALPEGIGIFDDVTEIDLAYAFLEFVLSRDVQAELARRNVQLPAVEGIDLDPSFAGIAPEPTDPVSLSYTELRGTIDEWLTEWTDRFDAESAE